MNKILLACVLVASSVSALAGDGILQLTADEGGFSIYIDGKKKAVTPDNEGQSIKLQLPEGDHTLEAVKDKNQWNEYRESKTIFVGADVIQPLHLKLSDAELKVKPSTIEHNRRQMAEQGWVDNGDGTASNSKTGLTWKRCHEGQTWTGSTCTGKPKEYTWDEAKKLKSSFAGKTDWRLPSIDELHTIVYCTDGRETIQRGKGKQVFIVNGTEMQLDLTGECLGNSFQKPSLNVAVFPSDLSTYDDLWSGLKHATNNELAWYLSDHGSEVWKPKSSTSPVRLVRGQ